jgi:D-alanine--poly(phosphoribitol) ligase subunit 2
MRHDIAALIVQQVQEVGSEQSITLPADLNDSTALFGQNGLLDSLSLVSLVVTVEQAVEDQYGVLVSLTDDKAMSQKNSPYRTIGSLADYICTALQDAA